MAKLKFTKQELRSQQVRLQQLQRYLPTLQLRKAMLQSELFRAEAILEELQDQSVQAWKSFTHSLPLLSLYPFIKAEQIAHIDTMKQEYENIAGVELPVFSSLAFSPLHYSAYDTPPWLDVYIEEARTCKTLDGKKMIAQQRMRILQKELNEVFIRVNLFEKILIPKCVQDIRSIKIFLDDLNLSSVSQAKKAKEKIEARKQLQEAIS